LPRQYGCSTEFAYLLSHFYLVMTVTYKCFWRWWMRSQKFFILIYAWWYPFHAVGPFSARTCGQYRHVRFPTDNFWTKSDILQASILPRQYGCSTEFAYLLSHLYLVMTVTYKCFWRWWMRSQNVYNGVNSQNDIIWGLIDPDV
jgi:nicotinamide riboside transporter PnuC